MDFQPIVTRKNALYITCMQLYHLSAYYSLWTRLDLYMYMDTRNEC